MSYAFDHLDLIEELLQRFPFGLITDIDGTISPTVATPQQAMVSPLCHHYLAILCRQLALVAAISGRPVVEVKDMVAIDGMVYIGNHGLERWTDGHAELLPEARDYSGVVKAALEEITPLLAAIEGIIIQDKGITATIHYRLCPNPELAERQILAAVADSPRSKGLRVMQEKMAIDLLPPVKANKGTATSKLIQDYDLRGGVYLGDDITDIESFRAIRAAYRDSDFRGVAIGITGPEMPQELIAEVDFTLDGVGEVEHFLQWMSQILPQPRSRLT